MVALFGAGVMAETTAKAFFMVDPAFLAKFPLPAPPVPVFVCRYNPKDLTVSGGANWRQPETNQQHDLAPALFVRPSPRTIKIKLLIDQFELPSGDVSKEVDILFDWTRPRTSLLPIPKGQVSAPWLRFQWGAKRWFKCFIKTLSVTYTLFSVTGTPLRATADVTLEETLDAVPGTNPTSGGEGGERRHVISVGETLHSIAQQYYGDPRLWRGLASFNGVDDPLRLATGTTLAIPSATDAADLA